AVLPEYAVDLYFAWSAGHVPDNVHYASANMTGSNRLLLGLGWPFVVLLFALGARRRKERASGIELEPMRRVDLGFLGAASLYTLIVPFTRRIAWYDSVVFWRCSRCTSGERRKGIAKSPSWWGSPSGSATFLRAPGAPR